VSVLIHIILKIKYKTSISNSFYVRRVVSTRPCPPSRGRFGNYESRSLILHIPMADQNFGTNRFLPWFLKSIHKSVYSTVKGSCLRYLPPDINIWMLQWWQGQLMASARHTHWSWQREAWTLFSLAAHNRNWTR